MEIILSVLFIIGLIYFFTNPSKKSKSPPSPSPAPIEDEFAKFQKRDYFFRSQFERIFFENLKEALKNEPYYAFSQVRLADLVKTTTYNREAIYLKTLPYHVDFVVCKLPEYKIVCAIELDSPSHDSVKQMERDLFKAKVLDNAGLLLLKYRVEDKTLTPEKTRQGLRPYLEMSAEKEHLSQSN